MPGVQRRNPGEINGTADEAPAYGVKAGREGTSRAGGWPIVWAIYSQKEWEPMNGKGHAAPRAVNDRRAVSRIVCGEIDNERRPHKATSPRQKKLTRWRAGTCRICGEWSSYISQDHARRHGYKNADEMAHADVMDWTE